MRTKTKAFLWVALVFLVGVAFGAVLTWRLNRPQLAAPPLGAVEQSVPRPSPSTPAGPRGQGTLVRMLRQLDLDGQQESEVRAIIEDARLQQQRLTRQSAVRVRRLRRETLDSIRQVLTPEQRRQLGLFLRQLRREHREK